MARKTNANSKKKETITLRGVDTEIVIIPYEDDKMLGFATLTIYGFIKIYNCKVIDGENGIFLAMPNYKGSDNKYYSHAYLDDEDKDGRFVVDEISALLDAHYND